MPHQAAPMADQLLLTSIDNHSGKRKRDSVAPAACNECRIKKRRCEGVEPCKACRKRGIECVFQNKPGETPRVAQKRKLEEATRHDERNRKILDRFANGDERDALELLRHIRAGRGTEFVDSGFTSALISPAIQRLAIMAICQSSVTLQQLVRFASAVMGSTMIAESFDQVNEYLKNRLIDHHLLTTIINSTNSASSTLRSLQVNPSRHQAKYHYVTAKPWTDVTSSNEAVSYLITIFLRFGNGYWRFVEEDLFLGAMREGKPYSEYCSPLLVNAMCAWASTYSEIDEAFIVPGQYITRGTHFYDKACQLWRLEQGRSSMTSISALMIMAVDSAMRGKDDKAPIFCKEAVNLLRNLQNRTQEYPDGPNRWNYERARSNLAVGVIWEEFSNCTGLMRHLDTVNITTADLPDLDFLPDHVEDWSGHPYASRSVEWRPDLLARERRALTVFMEELLRIVAPGNTHTRDSVLEAASDLGTRMTNWHNGLHSDLRPTKNMPVPLYEFHAQYSGLMIQLFNRAWLAAFGDSGSASVENVRDDLHSGTTDTRNNNSDSSGTSSTSSNFGIPRLRSDNQSDGTDNNNSSSSLPAFARFREQCREEYPLLALKHAWTGATLLRDYRERYGMKICVPYLIQHAAENIFFLLLDLPRCNPMPAPSAHTTTTTATGGDDNSVAPPIDNTPDAFIECFRMLLGSGVQVMMPRAISRMVFITASEVLKIRMPLVVEQMLALVASTSWGKNDIQYVNSSVWPNLAMKDEKGRYFVDGRRKSVEMGALLKRWENMSMEDREVVAQASASTAVDGETGFDGGGDHQVEEKPISEGREGPNE